MSERFLVAVEHVEDFQNGSYIRLTWKKSKAVRMIHPLLNGRAQSGELRPMTDEEQQIVSYDSREEGQRLLNFYAEQLYTSA